MDSNNAHFGITLAIHSITMLLGVFFLTPLAFSFSNFSLIIVGAGIGSLASGFLIIDDQL